MLRAPRSRGSALGLCALALIAGGTGQASATPTQTASPVPAEVPCSPIEPGLTRPGRGFGTFPAGPYGHTGLDFSAREGTPVRAVAAGTVQPPTAGEWAGEQVVLRHADGSASVYAHLSAVDVQVGQRVSAGEQIGAVGTTGKSFGPHLHLEHYPRGVVGDRQQAEDPLTWLRTRPCTSTATPSVTATPPGTAPPPRGYGPGIGVFLGLGVGLSIIGIVVVKLRRGRGRP